MIVETTPVKITEPIKRFCKTIVGKKENEPVFINVQPHERSREQHCFENVSEMISRNGGLQINGWLIWQRGNMYLYAEAHSVWMNDEGKLIDVTPPHDGEKRILFLRDDRVQYCGIRIPSKFYQLTKSKKVLKFIRLREEGYFIEADLKLDGMTKITKLNQLKQQIKEYNNDFLKDVNENDPCPCGSGRKYKDCCLLASNQLLDNLKEMGKD